MSGSVLVAIRCLCGHPVPIDVYIVSGLLAAAPIGFILWQLWKLKERVDRIEN